MTALKRIKANTSTSGCSTRAALPNFGINFYILNKRGEHAGVSMYNEDGKQRYAVCDDKGARFESLDALYEGAHDK